MNEKDKVYNKNKVNSSVNPQGQTEDEASNRPQSELEHRAKKTNTKR